MVSRILLAVFLLVMSLSALALAAPGLARWWIFAEDRLVETATAIAYLAAGLVAGRALLAGARPRSWLGFVAGVGLLGFLDEMSFGERMIGFEAPVVGGVKIDAAHDLAQLARRILDHAFDAPVLTALALAACLLVAALALRAAMRRRPPPHAGLIVAAVACVTAAQSFDLHLPFLRHDVLSATYLEESLELASGLFLLAFGWLCAEDGAVRRRVGGRLSPDGGSRSLRRAGRSAR